MSSHIWGKDAVVKFYFLFQRMRSFKCCQDSSLECAKLFGKQTPLFTSLKRCTCMLTESLALNRIGRPLVAFMQESIASNIVVWLFLTRLTKSHCPLSPCEGNCSLSHLSRQDLFQNSIVSTTGSVFTRWTLANTQVSHLIEPHDVSLNDFWRIVSVTDEHPKTVNFMAFMHIVMCEALLWRTHW